MNIMKFKSFLNVMAIVVFMAAIAFSSCGNSQPAESQNKDNVEATTDGEKTKCAHESEEAENEGCSKAKKEGCCKEKQEGCSKEKKEGCCKANKESDSDKTE